MRKEMALGDEAKNCDLGSADIAKMAERELGAFFNAVKELFGAKQAQFAAKDWLEEWETTNAWPVAIREWRRITIRASRRLAARLDISFQCD